VSQPDLRPGERAIETYRANRSQGLRAVGGHLLLTDQRVVFYPHKFDSAIGGRPWECDLKSISKVSTAPRGRNPFDGSIRRRLQIDGQTTELFVVNKVDSVVEAIEEATGR
jgi:hypothetical protein